MYGREGQLRELKRVMNDPTKPKFVRLQADRNYHKILKQLRDPKLMSLREQLIKATRNQDGPAVDKITQRMRAYEGEDRDSGL